MDNLGFQPLLVGELQWDWGARGMSPEERLHLGVLEDWLRALDIHLRHTQRASANRPGPLGDVMWWFLLPNLTVHQVGVSFERAVEVGLGRFDVDAFDFRQAVCRRLLSIEWALESLRVSGWEASVRHVLTCDRWDYWPLLRLFPDFASTMARRDDGRGEAGRMAS